MLEKTLVFALTSNIEMAEEVVQNLGLELGKCEVKHFADGEIIVDILQSVRGKNVYVIQSTCPPVTERLMELLVFVDALKRASAKEINVVIGYYGYSRQDRKAKAREPITARLVADLLETAGISRLVTFDLHAPQIQGFFNCPVDDLSAIPLFARYLKGKLAGKSIVVVSPDHGGATRARKLATFLDASIAIIDKRRPQPNVSEVMNIIGDVKGKTAVMVDDIIDTAGTIAAGAKAIIDSGAESVYAVCSHGIFSGPAHERLENSPFVESITTNTIPLPAHMRNGKVKVLSVAPMIAKAIEHIELGLALSIVYDLYNL
ncbi:MAG: ribose-phosphate pyrophosphokinase [Bacilli bacterium]